MHQQLIEQRTPVVGVVELTEAEEGRVVGGLMGFTTVYDYQKGGWLGDSGGGYGGVDSAGDANGSWDMIVDLPINPAQSQMFHYQGLLSSFQMLQQVLMNLSIWQHDSAVRIARDVDPVGDWDHGGGY